MNQCRYIAPLPFVLLLSSLSSGCNRGETKESESLTQEGILVSIGDSTLTLERVLRRIPAGLTEADSTALFNAIVEQWVSDRLATDVALNNIPDPEGIERMVRQYRTSLVLDRYRRMMVAETAKLPQEDSLRAYYERYKSEMIIERPIVKGILMILPSDAPDLERVRKWMANAGADDIRRVESYAVAEASQFDNFLDTWVDFGSIAGRIPHRFGREDEFVAANKDFEIADRGRIYMLHITDRLPAGSRMPYEFARPQILDILMRDSQELSERSLYRSLLEKGLKQGSVKPGVFDPSTLFN